MQGAAEAAQAAGPCRYPSCTVVTLSQPLRPHPRTLPARNLNIDLKVVCLDCAVFPGFPAIQLHDDDRAMIQSAKAVGTDGSMGAFSFPSFEKIAKLDSAHAIVTDKRGRIDEAPSVNEAYLEGRLRSALRFTASRGYRMDYPRDVNCPGIAHPLIVHAGLIRKILDNRRDPNHFRYAGYIYDVIEHPIETWLYSEPGRQTFRVFGLLRTGDRVDSMMVIAEATSHICDTAYVIRATQEQTYRSGRLVQASWILRPS